MHDDDAISEIDCIIDVVRDEHGCRALEAPHANAWLSHPHCEVFGSRGSESAC